MRGTLVSLWRDGAQSCHLCAALLLVAGIALAQPSDLVTAHGREFMRAGQPYHFVGVNLRGLVHYGAGAPLPYTTTGDIGYNLDGVAGFGGKVIRVFAANKHLTTATLIANLTYALDQMEARGQKALVCMTDLYGATDFHPAGDDPYYMLQPGGYVLLDDTWFAAGYKLHYLPWVQAVAGALKNHNAVFAWEIGNELTDIKVPANIIPFTLDVAQKIKAADPWHMVGTGFIGIDHTQIGEAAGKALYESPYLDFISAHSYDGSDPQQNWATHARVEKPLLLGEYGRDNAFGDQVAFTQNAVSFWFDTRGARGFLQWGYQYNTTDIGDGDSMFGMDRNMAAARYNDLAAVYQARASLVLPPLPPLGLPPGSNVAPLATAWATDSNFSSAYGGDKAIDGVVSAASKWTSSGNPPPHWLALDLGAARDITGFVVKSAGEAMEFVSFGFKTYELQTGSSLAGPWATIATASNPNQVTVSKTFLPSQVSARFVRLLVTNAGIDNYARLPEFEVYAAGAAAVGGWPLY